MNILKIKAQDIINKNTFRLIKKEIKFENSYFDKDFYIGIRPEDISLEKNSEIEIDTSVDLVENLGKKVLALNAFVLSIPSFPYFR